MEPFELSGVVHLARPTGRTAHDLDALRYGIESAEPAALFHHCIQVLLRHGSVDDPPPDDFSGWVYGVLQDRETAERLAFAGYDRFHGPEPLRAGLLSVLDKIPPRTRAMRDAPEGGEFHFVTVDSVAIPTGTAPADAQTMLDALLEADDTVWFWHLVEEPWSRAGTCPLCEWLREAGATGLAARIEEGVQQGIPIGALKRRIRRATQRAQLARRVAEAVQVPEDQRRAEARSVVAGLVSRMRRGTP